MPFYWLLGHTVRGDPILKQVLIFNSLEVNEKISPQLTSGFLADFKTFLKNTFFLMHQSHLEKNVTILIFALLYSQRAPFES